MKGPEWEEREKNSVAGYHPSLLTEMRVDRLIHLCSLPWTAALVARSIYLLPAPGAPAMYSQADNHLLSAPPGPLLPPHHC